MRASVVWLETIILGMMLCLGSSCMISFMYVMQKPMISYTEEKSALDTNDVISEPKAYRYGKDLLASLVNSDELAPYPNAIRIDDSPVLKLDSTFMVMKFDNLVKVYSATGSYRLSTKLNDKIKDVRFENYGGVDCLHYYITTTPP